MNQQAILDALEALITKWQGISKNAAGHSSKGGLGKRSSSHFDGIVEGLDMAMKDIRKLIDEQQLAAEEAEAVPEYVPVSKYGVERLLRNADIKIANLYDSLDHIFTIILPPIMILKTLDEIVDKLDNTSESLVILDYGRVPDTREPFIDFAFIAPLDEVDY